MIVLKHRSECRVIGSGQQLRPHAVFTFLTAYLTFELRELGNETVVQYCGLYCVDLGTGNERHKLGRRPLGAWSDQLDANGHIRN